MKTANQRFVVVVACLFVFLLFVCLLLLLFFLFYFVNVRQKKNHLPLFIKKNKVGLHVH